MSLKGTTALIRLAQNPDCEILGAMVMQEGSEKLPRPFEDWRSPNSRS
jgi:hypothetical protein